MELASLEDVRVQRPAYRSEEGERYIDETCRRNYAAWAVPIRPRLLDTPYGRTFVAETGRPGLPPLCVFHGMTSNSSFSHLLYDLPWLSQRYNAFFVDTPGDNGWSTIGERPKNGRFYSSWILAVLEQLGIERPAFVGVSYGAFISLQFAAEHPQRVRKLLALCPVGALGGISLSFMPRFLPQVFHPDPARIGELFREIGHISRTPAMEQVISYIGQNLTHRNGLVIFWPRTLARSELARIPAPCVCVIGSEDPFGNVARARRRLRGLGDRIQLKTVPGAGHFLGGSTAELVRELLPDPS